ncbi:proline-rich protein 36 [Drosophila bipectinata]|uniref:proline-rich protein 36 n=1 Tax=Drosophila bipectinata TaxID=42026 RepID=UPI0038B27F8D
MYRKLVITVLLIHLTAGGEIRDAAEEIDVPPAHRAAPPRAPPAAPLGPAPPPPTLVTSAPPPNYPLFFPAAWLPYGRFSASIPPLIVAGPV